MNGSKMTRRSIIGGVAAGGALAATATSAQASPKTFVLVHGTYVGGWYWRRVADLLERNGHRVFAPTLTGLGERSHLLSKDVNLVTHVTDIVNVFKWEDLTDISAAARLPSREFSLARRAIQKLFKRLCCVAAIIKRVGLQWVDRFDRSGLPVHVRFDPKEPGRDR